MAFFTPQEFVISLVWISLLSLVSLSAVVAGSVVKCDVFRDFNGMSRVSCCFLFLFSLSVVYVLLMFVFIFICLLCSCREWGKSCSP